MTLPDESRGDPSPTRHWARTRGLVEELLALPREARDAFLDARCSDDVTLRARVERLAAAWERTGEGWGFLAQPAGQLAAPLLSASTPSESAYVLERLNSVLADRYRIERELGAGGMATVYLAHDLRHGRQVAVKVLHPELSAMLGAERFLGEIKTTAGLQHPNILPLFDSGSTGGLLFYVMPLVDGETLRARLKREKQLPVADALSVATEIAGAIEYAHRRGVIHRDIKPENILLHDGRPVIADFGIALAVQSADVQRMTQPGRSLGTPQYMSPEQTSGDQVITPRSDIYALGAVTYEMLTGEPPFTGATVQQIVARVRADEPRSITMQRKHVPPHVEAAVFTALEKTPADRFISAAAFAQALGDPGFRGVVSAGASVGTVAHRNEPRLATIVSLVAAVVGLAVVAAWGWLRAPAERLEVARFQIPLPPGLSISTTAATGNLAVSPDGRTVVFAASAADGVNRLYARAVDEITPRRLAGTEGALEPFFSPDGRWIGFFSRGNLHVVAADGGLPRIVAAFARHNSATWTRNDVIVVGTANGLQSIPAKGGAPVLVVAPDSSTGEIAQMYPVALPGGDQLLYTSVEQDDESINLVSISNRTSKRLNIQGTNALGFIDGRIIYGTRENVLMAIPFDQSTGVTTGPAASVATGVSVGVVGAAKVALSLSGTLAFRTADRGSRMVLTNGRGEVEVLLPETRVYAFPRFSPNGQRIAISVDAGTRSDIWIYDLKAHTGTQLSTGGSSNDRPEWSPDGRRVLYRTDEGTASSIFWRAIDLSEEASSLTAGGRRAFFEGVIAQDGRSLVYQVDNDVELIELGRATAPRAVATSDHIENQARVSRDGKWIAFVTDETGSDQVVVQPFPGPGNRVQVSVNGGTEPVWARDGQRLFYRANKKIMTATFTTTPTFAVSSRDVFVDDRFVSAPAPHANYDVSPDGTRLLVLEAIEDPQIHVVHNWGSEMRERLTARPPRRQ